MMQKIVKSIRDSLAIQRKIITRIIFLSKRQEIVDSVINLEVKEHQARALLSIIDIDNTRFMQYILMREVETFKDIKIDYCTLEKIINKINPETITSSLFFYPPVKNETYTIILNGSRYVIRVKNIPKDLHKIQKDSRFIDPYAQ